MRDLGLWQAIMDLVLVLVLLVILGGLVIAHAGV